MMTVDTFARNIDAPAALEADGALQASSKTLL